MPATVNTDIDEMWKNTDNKLIDRVPFNDATDMENPVTVTDDENASTPPDSDSTYNLEDHVTPPAVTPHVYSDSKSGSDNTGDSVEEIETDSFGEIIPKYLFQLPSSTRALNIEFNKCLLLDIDPLPSTSCLKDLNKNINAGISKTGKSSNSDSSLPQPKSKPSKKQRKRISRIAAEKVTDEEESISTDCEVKSERSSNDTQCSLSLDSTETDKLIPSFLFRLLDETIINPELELCFDFEDDSRATDNDIMTEQSFSAKTDLYVEDHFEQESDDTEQRKWNESELVENKKPVDDFQSKDLSSPTDLSLLSLKTVLYEDSEEFIPRYLFAETT